MNNVPCGKCNRSVTKVFNCMKCDKKFCSNNCMIDHTFESHQQPNENKEKISYKRRSTMKSPFMKFGDYLRDIRDDPLYEFKNFEFVKVGKKPQVLGCGAFGDVYLAKNKVDNKHYAIKQMNKNKITEHGAKLDIVVREINVHRRLVHENIVRMYSSYEDKESFFIIMDYVNSGTLFNLIKKKNGMDEKTAFKYFIHTAAAVNFLHENNLVHRDLKPENLLIDENDTVKLCDFGWCVELAVGNRSTFCGTYEYMAPEIINESPYNSGIDVWSLGVLLYELLHGYSPFRAKINRNSDQEYIEIFKNIVKYNFKIEKQVSESCADLIKKLLSPEIKNRIKVRDIFFQPWVVSFEKEFKEQRLNSALASEVKVKSNLPLKLEDIPIIPHPGSEKPKMSDNYKSVENNQINTKLSSKNSLKVDQERSFENDSILSKEKIIKDNLNQQKVSQVDKIINNKQNDFSLLESSKDTLFDKVLNQVQEKNKTKKKRNKVDDTSIKESSFNLSEGVPKKGSLNKIAIVANKPDIKDKMEESFVGNKDNQKLDPNNFSILNEMNDFENKIKEIEKSNKKFNEVKKNSIKNADDYREVIQGATSNNSVQLNPNDFKPSKNKKVNDDYNEFNLLGDDRPIEKENKKSFKGNDNEVYKKNLLKNEKNLKEDKIERVKQRNFIDNEDSYYNREEDYYNEETKKNNKKPANYMNDSYNLNNDKPYPNTGNGKASNSIIEKEGKSKNEYNDKNNLSKQSTKPKSLLDKGKKNTNHEVNPDRPKNVDKELDLSFLPKELLYNEKSYCESKNNLLAAIEILEKAQDNKNQVQNKEKPQESKSFWSILNPFKCGNNN